MEQASDKPLIESQRDLLSSYGSSAPETNRLAEAQRDLLSSYVNAAAPSADSKLGSYSDKSGDQSADAKLGTYSDAKSSGGDSADSKLTSYGSDASAGKLPVAVGDESAANAPPSEAKSKYITEHVRDWNGEFQRAMEMEPSPQKFMLLKSVALDFVETAKLYGRVRGSPPSLCVCALCVAFRVCVLRYLVCVLVTQCACRLSSARRDFQ